MSTPTTPTWAAGHVTVDEGKTIVAGEYRTDIRWNGWLCPRMGFDETVEVLAALAEETIDYYIYMIDGDDIIVYTYEDDGYDGSEEVHSPFEGKWYSVGAFAWCWEDASPWINHDNEEN